MKDKKVAIVGLGIEGKSAAIYLSSIGAKLTIFDQKPISELDTSGLENIPIEYVTGPNYLSNGFIDFDYIVRSPGIYRYIPEFITAEKQGAIITSAIKIFFEKCPAKIIGVTGTKGKGTTSTLIYEILKFDKYDVHLAGNIGRPCLELLNVLDHKSWVVLELSSFQLIDLDISPHIGVVLNITVDHLDWHKDRDEYVNAKKNIISHQKNNDFSVINADYDTPMSFVENTQANKLFFSRYKKVDGAYVEERIIKLKDEIVGTADELLLRGEHNWENVTAAITATYAANAQLDSIKSVIFSFKGLEHRLELVRTVNGVEFYNDSFSTNPQPTIAAVESFTESVTLILGGSDKGLNYDEMAEVLSARENLKTIILIGDIADTIERSFEKAGFKGKIFKPGICTMTGIVETAVKNTLPGGVVLLSPATASFGMFKDYKDRGNQFKQSVLQL